MSAMTDLLAKFQAMHDDALKMEQTAQAHRAGVEAAIAELSAEINRAPTFDDLRAMVNKIADAPRS